MTAPAVGRVLSPAVPEALRRPVTWTWALVVVVLGVRAWLQLSLKGDVMIDMHVYRDAGVSLLQGQPVYAHYTVTDYNILPFTYPPFAALLAVPMAVLPMAADRVLWQAALVVALIVVLRIVLRPVQARVDVAAPRFAPLLLPVAVLIASWVQPIDQQTHLGQVGTFLLLLVVVDLLTPATGRWQGVLTGVAAAVKLTPALIVVVLLLAGRRRAAAVAAGSFAGATALAWALAPGSSVSYWTDALFNSSRIGDNSLLANQALRGMVLRTPLTPAIGTALWLVAALAVAVVGARRAAAHLRAGDQLTGVALAGILTAVVSPLSWVHHFTYILLILVVLARDRRWRRLIGLGLLWSIDLTALAHWFLYYHDVHLGLLWNVLGDLQGLSALAIVLFWPRPPAAAAGEHARAAVSHVEIAHEATASAALAPHRAGVESRGGGDLVVVRANRPEVARPPAGRP